MCLCYIILFGHTHYGVFEYLCCSTNILRLNPKHIGNFTRCPRALCQSACIQYTISLDTKSHCTTSQLFIIELSVHHLSIFKNRVWEGVTCLVNVTVCMKQ